MKPRLLSTVPRAFSLVEVVLALGIATFCLMTLLGLFSVGINSSKASEEELRAAHLAQSILATRRAAPTALLNSADPNAALDAAECPLPPLNASAEETVEVSDGDSSYQLYYKITPAPAGEIKPSTVYLRLSWPASALPANAAGRYEVTSSIAAN